MNLQFDDVYDSHHSPKRKQKFYYKNFVVRALDKKEAVEEFRKAYNLVVTRKLVTNDYEKRVQ